MLIHLHVDTPPDAKGHFWAVPVSGLQCDQCGVQVPDPFTECWWHLHTRKEGALPGGRATAEFCSHECLAAWASGQPAAADAGRLGYFANLIYHYGRHQPTCPLWRAPSPFPADPERVCTCGFSTALADSRPYRNSEDG